MTTKAIFFDFDGVIMDSMALKLDSYCDCLREFNFPREKINRIMRQNMGTSRRRIIISIYEELSGQPIPDPVFEKALARFNELDEASRSRMELIPGTLEFLQQVHAGYFTAIVTGTPEEVIRRTTAYHDLDRYFDIVRGSPDTKTRIIGSLMSDHNFKPEECFFIGDGHADQVAAANCRMRFVGMNYGGDSSFDPAKAWRVINNLTTLIPVP